MADKIKVNFIDKNGEKISIDAEVGISILEVAHQNKIDIPGICEGSLSCSTCHVIVDSDWFEKLDEASEDEEDMLDLAMGLTKTSRLSCQIKTSKELDGIVIKLPQD